MPRPQTLRITSTSPNCPQRPFTQRTARTPKRSRRSSVLCSRSSCAALITVVRGRNFTLITPDVLGYERVRPVPSEVERLHEALHAEHTHTTAQYAALYGIIRCHNGHLQDVKSGRAINGISASSRLA